MTLGALATQWGDGAVLRCQMTDGVDRLEREDPVLFDILEREARRQGSVLSLIASSSIVDPSVLACMASVAANVTAEGYPGRRYHAGTAVIDEIEDLAICRASSLFAARYVNVQPHSASTANYAVLTALLDPGDTILGMGLGSGGHLTHGAGVALSGTYFNAVNYGIAADGRIDLDQVRDLARRHRPKMIICGTTAYPRTIDFAGFRAIADQVGAILVADISHVAGLVAAGLHPSPVDHAHVTTLCTHKQMYGPRGAIIISGRDADERPPHGRGTIRQTMQRAIFPFLQGAPSMHLIAGKARAFELAAMPAFRERAGRILTSARAMADTFGAHGHHVVSGGTDNHIVLVDVRSRMSGLVAERALEECGIIVNKNLVPDDPRPPTTTSGIRLGANTIAHRGMASSAARVATALICELLQKLTVLDDTSYQLAADVVAEADDRIADLVRRYPMPGGRPVTIPAEA